MAHSKAYYLIRSVVRTLVGFILVAGSYLAIHALASNIVSAVLGSAVLFGIYFAVGHYQNKKAISQNY